MWKEANEDVIIKYVYIDWVRVPHAYRQFSNLDQEVYIIYGGPSCFLGFTRTGMCTVVTAQMSQALLLISQELDSNAYIAIVGYFI